MPDSTITAPVAADPIDRLVLGATDARAISPSGADGAFAAVSPMTAALGPCACVCVAEE